MNLVPCDAETAVIQNGDHNIAIAHAESINLTIAAPPTKEENIVQHTFWGGIEIPLAEAKLLDEFRDDYDDVIWECIKTDFSCPALTSTWRIKSQSLFARNEISSPSSSGSLN